MNPPDLWSELIGADEGRGEMRVRSRHVFVTSLLAVLAATFAGAAGAQTGPNNAITDVPGVEVGHSTRTDALTGTTALIFRDGALLGYAPSGGAPGNRLAALLTSTHQDSQRVVFHGLTLSGGSIYGLDTACGAVKYLDEQGLGFGEPRRPYVPGAIIFDLGRGPINAPPGRSTPTNPDPCSDGYIAASNASGGPVEQGSVGGGTGARAGGLQSGLGTASTVLSDGTVVGALVVVNSGGGVYNTRNECELYTLWLEQDDEFGDVGPPAGGCEDASTGLPPSLPGQNTTIGVVATNAPLTAGQTQRMAIIAGDGMARAIKPAHGNGDGDTVFGVATGGDPSTVEQSSYVTNSGTIYQAAADAYSRAITHAILSADPDLTTRETYCERFPTACPSAGSGAGATPAGGGGFGFLLALGALVAAAALAAVALTRTGRALARRARIAWLAVLAGIVVLGVAAAPAVAAPPSTGPSNAITDVPGVLVGHSTREDARTGTTSLVFLDGSLMGFASASGGPETHLSTLLTGQHQDTLRVAMHGLVLSGGSVYGLDTVCGTVRYLDDQGVGFGGRAHVPGATIFDLGRGDVDAPPGKQTAANPDPCADGYMAASTASGGPVEQGSVGGGTGAMAGELVGGLGTASTVLPDGTVVGALAIVNSSGRVYNDLGRCELFGLELELDDEFGKAREPSNGCKKVDLTVPERGPLEGNVVGVVATSAPLTGGQTEQLAIVVGDGIAKSVRPAHSSADGNAVFGVTVVEDPATIPQTTFVEAEELDDIYEAAVNAFSRAITHAVLNANPDFGKTYCEKFPKAKACARGKKGNEKDDALAVAPVVPPTTPPAAVSSPTSFSNEGSGLPLAPLGAGALLAMLLAAVGLAGARARRSGLASPLAPRSKSGSAA